MYKVKCRCWHILYTVVTFVELHARRSLSIKHSSARLQKEKKQSETCHRIEKILC